MEENLKELTAKLMQLQSDKVAEFQANQQKTQEFENKIRLLEQTNEELTELYE